MKEVAYPAAAALAAVFAWAGGIKLRQPHAVAESMRGLGVPLPSMTAHVLPVVELAVAALLLTLPSVGAVFALAVLTVFSAVIAASIRAGATVACGCLGTASKEPVSEVELVRNGLLAVLAGVAMFATGPQPPSLGAAIAVSTAVVTGTLIVSLARLRREVGAVWSNREAREGAVP